MKKGGLPTPNATPRPRSSERGGSRITYLEELTPGHKSPGHAQLIRLREEPRQEREEQHGSRETPRDHNREQPRDHHREQHREQPRDHPREPPRDQARDGPRDGPAYSRHYSSHGGSRRSTAESELHRLEERRAREGRERQEPLSKLIARNLPNFEDQNTTPSPAATMVR